MEMAKGKEAPRNRNGFTFIEHCHKERLCIDVPIVVISAVQDAPRRISEMPVHAYMAKPFDLNTLLEMIGGKPN